MAKKPDPHARADKVAGRMSQQLRVRGEHLPEVAAKAGHRLPKRLQEDLKLILEADRVADNPKLAKRIDAKQLAKAQRRLEAWLDRQDPSAERWAEFQDLVAKIAFIVLSAVLAAFALLIWRGVL